MTVRDRVRRLSPPASDIVLATGLLLLGQAEVWLIAGVNGRVAAPLMAVSAVALAWRRRVPLTVAVIVMGTQATASLLGVSIDSLNVVIPVWVIAIYSIAAHSSSVRAALGLGLSLVVVAVAIFVAEGPGVDNLVFSVVVVGGPWLAGWLVRRRMEQAVALALRAQELERSQTERERAAAADERDRIARELHDLVSHSVTVMTIQAGAVEEVIDQDPDKAREAAAAIRRTGRQALVDLRRMLGLLREDAGGKEALTPQPGLADLDTLVTQVRAAGLDVRIEIDGTPSTLPPALDLSAFRVVQEALTNTLKHARASVARVGVRYHGDAVDIEVVDDGTGYAPGASGHGLVGMRERVALYGGQLEYGRQPSGGFRVHALLPLGGDGS